MGMFDYFRSSYDLGEQFTNVVCQTKDIEEGIGGTMTDYWLDPSGKLWHPRYIGCHTIEIYEEGHPRYDPNAKWANFEWIPTGARGKLQHHPITKYIEIYPAESRLVDNANQFHLWCLADPEMKIPIGWDKRMVSDHNEQVAKSQQRPL